VADDAPPVPLPPNGVQVFWLVQPYQFWPAGALVLKNASATKHVAGRSPPDLKTIDAAPEKSLLPV
jgi:hypothetical protein